MNNTYKAWLVAGAILCASAIAAFAHGGASGIVKERMDGMSAMADTVKSLSNMFRSQNYDVAAITNGADAIAKHSGSNLISLFPKGSGGAPSEAKLDIWTNFDDFVALAEQLEDAAIALKAAAGNTQTSTNVQSDMMGSTMMGSDMMGSAMGDTASMMTPEMLSAMPADKVFDVVVRTCASCHTKYRIEK